MSDPFCQKSKGCCWPRGHVGECGHRSHLDIPAASRRGDAGGWRDDPKVQAEIAEAKCADGIYRFTGTELSRLCDAIDAASGRATE